MDVEKLIECVRAHVCLYDLGHNQYKNIVLKNAIWESIGRELNQSGEAVKQKWKTIRDGYTKYKKQAKGTTGSSRKNINYTWASQLAFLDLFNVPRASYSNVSPGVVQTSPSSPQSQTSGHSARSPVSHTAQSQSPVPSPPTQMPPPSQISSPPPQAAPSPSLTPQSSSQASTSSKVSARKSKRHAESDDDVGRVLQYLKNKKRKELDVTDNLFLSYADTFKKFPPREQAIVKLELAKLFSNIELRLLDSNSYSTSTYNLQTSTSMASPAYSTSSVVTNQNIDSPTSQPINLSGNDNVVEHANSLLKEFNF
ncbi:unnamed protein product [Euphydryas editha]|uniref:MADF domain-containing protein n=1 Tax=Euphydryas editha TaxID=104508 RepID=A0AAU9UPS9_EUPED|nr:unnamed protein product [Euphydryas editha]